MVKTNVVEVANRTVHNLDCPPCVHGTKIEMDGVSLSNARQAQRLKWSMERDKEMNTGRRKK